MAILIAWQAARAIADDALAQVPNEACGLIAGDGYTIHRAIPLANFAADKGSRFALEPAQQLAALKQLDAERLVWMGVYHSHPNTPAIPSPADIAGNSDANLLQLIVSLKRSKPEMQLWHLGAANVKPLELIFDTQSAAQLEESNQFSETSQKQGAAIAVAALISVLLMLALSFSLLPPAP